VCARGFDDHARDVIVTLDVRQAWQRKYLDGH